MISIFSILGHMIRARQGGVGPNLKGLWIYDPSEIYITEVWEENHNDQNVLPILYEILSLTQLWTFSNFSLTL